MGRRRVVLFEPFSNNSLCYRFQIIYCPTLLNEFWRKVCTSARLWMRLLVITYNCSNYFGIHIINYSRVPNIIASLLSISRIFFPSFTQHFPNKFKKCYNCTQIHLIPTSATHFLILILYFHIFLFRLPYLKFGVWKL